jgi:hypothetical protein
LVVVLNLLMVGILSFEKDNLFTFYQDIIVRYWKRSKIIRDVFGKVKKVKFKKGFYKRRWEKIGDKKNLK